MKNLYLILCIILTSFVMKAQTSVDALRYSQKKIAGTAKYVSMGGAYSALGADISCLTTNPAGLGVYRSSEFTITPSFYMSDAMSEYQNLKYSDVKYNFNFGNIGLVFNNTIPDRLESNKWKSVSFGFGYNKLNNFNERIITEGYNNNSSILDEWQLRANGSNAEDLSPFDTQLAYDTWLIDTLGSNTNYTTAMNSYGQLQRKSLTAKGGISQFNFSFGANYDDRIYLGAGVGFTSLRYVEDGIYVEDDVKDAIYDFKSLKVEDYLKTTGAGIDFKVGVIYRAQDWLRLSAAFHTPTFYAMEDEYNRTISSSFDNGDGYEASSPSGNFEYAMTTPFKAIGGMAFVINKIAIISTEYEYSDVSETRFREDNTDYFDVNNSIKRSYDSQHNLRCGTEINLNPISLRLGFAYSTSPYKTNILNNGETFVYSAGIGYREKNFFIDLAYQLYNKTEKYYLYNENLAPPFETKYTNSLIAFTFGYKF